MKRLRDDRDTGDQLVWLNVGGTKSLVLLDTLRSTTHFPDSLLAVWFAPEAPWTSQLVDGEYFVDFDPQLFALILRVLRCPPLRDCVPHAMSDEAWRITLDHWGLLPPVSQRRVQPVPESALQRLGKQIYSDVTGCEHEVVMALLRETGFLAQQGKVRLSRLYVPEGGHALSWGVDLYKALPCRETQIREVLKEMLPGVIVMLDRYKSKTALTYEFGGQKCSNADGRPLMEVIIDMTHCRPL